jgi:hypothetical protein
VILVLVVLLVVGVVKLKATGKLTLAVAHTSSGNTEKFAHYVNDVDIVHL